MEPTEMLRLDADARELIGQSIAALDDGRFGEAKELVDRAVEKMQRVAEAMNADRRRILAQIDAIRREQ